MSTFTPDNLFAGSRMPRVSEEITLEADAESALSLAIGTVLAKKANGKCVIIDSTGVGTTDEPYAVLGEAKAVPGATDTIAVAYLTGEFNQSKLVFGGTDTIATHKTAMRNIGMFAKTTISA